MFKRLFGYKAKRETPLDRFHRKILEWPIDAQEHGLKCLVAAMESDQAGIDRHFGELTVSQIETVRRALEEIEVESE